MVAAPVDRDVGVDVAGYGVDHAYPLLRVLEHARLLDVQLDPTCEVVEDADRVSPPSGLVAGLFGVLPEASPVVHGSKPLRSEERRVGKECRSRRSPYD